MIYPIVISGDEVLRRHCEPVPAAFLDLKQLVADMIPMSADKKTSNGGCLSFPGIPADVQRSLGIRMRDLDEEFKPHDEEFTGLKAWVIQHEYDHIEGTVFTDRISPLRRNLLKGKLLNLAKG